MRRGESAVAVRRVLLTTVGLVALAAPALASAAGAIAISQNVVITNTEGYGFITTYPTGLAQIPAVSNGNALAANQTRSVLSLTRMGATSVSYFTSMRTDVDVDITGYLNA